MNYIAVFAITEIEKDEYFIGVFEVSEGTTPEEILKTDPAITEFDPNETNDYYEEEVNGKLGEPEYFFIDPAVGLAISKGVACGGGVCDHAIRVAVLSICKNAKVDHQ